MAADCEKNTCDLDAVLAKLSEQHVGAAVDSAEIEPGKEDPISHSVPDTPATDGFSATPPGDDTSQGATEEGRSEMERLKDELDAAKSKIAKQEQELSQTRVIKQVLDQTKTNFPDANNAGKPDEIDRTIMNLQESFGASRPIGTYGNQDDTRSDVSDTLSATGYNRGQGVWMPAPPFNGGMQGAGNVWPPATGRSWMNRPMAPPLQPIIVPPQQQLRSFSGASSPVSNGPGKANDFGPLLGNNGSRRHNLSNIRSSSYLPQNRTSAWEPYSSAADPSAFMAMNPPSFQPMGMFQAPIGYQPRPIGTPLSPTAAEFTAGGPMSRWDPSASTPGPSGSLFG